jgi:exoribonuclease R
MVKIKEKDLMIGKFQWGDNFGFFIPTDRDYYGGDFYVAKENFWYAQDWDKVEAREIVNPKWKKPEAKIIKAYGREPVKLPVFIEWIYSGGDGNFGFIDVEWNDKWIFVYGNKKNGARDWDKVKAEVVDFNGRKEAVVVKIFKAVEELIIWKYRDKDSFGFVIPDKASQTMAVNVDIIWEDWKILPEKNKWTVWDIFIAWSRKNWAKDWDKVEVQIIKRWGKNPEGLVKRIIK